MAEKSGSKSKATKVLRIGIIQGGKIIEEQRFKKRETVSIGRPGGKKATFVVDSPNVPDMMNVFELTGGNYFLNFNDNMQLSLQDPDASFSDVASLKKHPKAAKKGDGYRFPLTDDNRGKVIFKDVTVLFQFVDPPLAGGKMDLPEDIRGGFLSSIDIQYTTILVVVGLIGISIVSYAAQQPYVEPSTVEQISERYQKLIMPDRPVEPPQVADKGEAADEGKGKEKKAKPEAKPKKKVAKGKSNSKGDGKGKKVSAEAAAKARKEALTKRVAGSGLLAVIGTQGEGDGALADVFADGSAADGDIGDAFSGIQGIDIADSSGAVGTRGGGSGESASIGDIATEGGGSVSTGTKQETAVKGTVGSEAPTVDGELSPDKIQRAMRKYLGAVKDCYERALKRNPKLAGKIVIGFEITERGKVEEFSFPVDNVGNADVRSCIKRRSRSWRFPKPDGGSVYVEFPLVFEPSQG